MLAELSGRGIAHIHAMLSAEPTTEEKEVGACNIMRQRENVLTKVRKLNQITEVEDREGEEGTDEGSNEVAEAPDPIEDDEDDEDGEDDGMPELLDVMEEPEESTPGPMQQVVIEYMRDYIIRAQGSRMA